VKILVTGGAGYIGSTICSALLDGGHTPVILDSLVTGRMEFTRGRVFYQGDIADRALIERVFREHPDITHTVHCAARIVVPDSVAQPALYYRENVAKALDFFETLIRLGCRRVVFSSSASIYDTVPGFMVNEDSPLNPSSPYARTKYMVEMILRDLCAATGAKAISLRYFNPIGADPQMRTGIHTSQPSHVLGRLVAAARGEIPAFTITGTDWPTRDGTGIRDYVHVWDLARAHINATERFDAALASSGDPGYLVVNLGTGRGVTVREIVQAFRKVWGRPMEIGEAPPRPGDVAGAYASCERATALLGWKAERSIEEGVAHALEWAEARRSRLGTA
jgi:UDP-glucose 4-epimerase